MNFAGDIDVEKVWESLENDSDASLIDVRSKAEWTFVGIPDLSSLGKEVVLVEWQSYPSMEVNENFLKQLEDKFNEDKKDHAIYFLCRSGARSCSAAKFMTSHGYKKAYNVMHGFEGILNDLRQRNTMSGWRAKGLPWLQA